MNIGFEFTAINKQNNYERHQREEKERNNPFKQDMQIDKMNARYIIEHKRKQEELYEKLEATLTKAEVEEDD